MMAVSLSSGNTPPSSTIPAAPLPPPRSSSLSPAAGSSSTATQVGRSRSSRKASHAHREVRFGNYILGQTLGEGEFGKVKLGWRKPEPGQTAGDGVQVAIKLIRKESVGTKTRMNKIDREIAILKRVHHPNIVKLCDVIYTDRHIGIILEYASGGELFDYILSHRYLKDHVACKLFAQLISGVSYLHEKGIVHRDLKLENLLLDQNRNIIITDFGFANTFNPDEVTEDNDLILASEDNRRVGDLMQTSCGSPCYAAPELVVTDGLYAGRKVDVWSCGVILYAMLAGYLPFDDDPSNPEGDNINLLYKYITHTPLTFPEYVSAMARDLLRQILKPKPEERMTLKQVKAHTWLYPHRSLFRTPLSAFEAQAKESISLLSATPMGRSVSAHEPSHATYVPASSSHLIPHIQQKGLSPPSSPDIVPSKSSDPRRHTVQLEYDKPSSKAKPTAEDIFSSTAATTPAKKVILDVPVKTKRSAETEISGLGVPPAPSLVRSATTGATTSTKPTVLDTVDEISSGLVSPRIEVRRPSESSSLVSGTSGPGVSRPPTSRPAMPHGSKPRPTSYHPPSTGGISMLKNRSASGDRTATLNMLQRQSSGSSSSKKMEPTMTETLRNVEGEISSGSKQGEKLVIRTTAGTRTMQAQGVVVESTLPQRSKSHKRASASISMVADRVFSIFASSTKQPTSPLLPQQENAVIDKPKENIGRSNTTRRNPSGATVLSKRRQNSGNVKNEASSPKASRHNTEPDILAPKIVRSNTEPQFIKAQGLLSPTIPPVESPKVSKSKKFGELTPDKGSSGAARKVMEFFRRRARAFAE